MSLTRDPHCDGAFLCERPRAGGLEPGKNLVDNCLCALDPCWPYFPSQSTTWPRAGCNVAGRSVEAPIPVAVVSSVPGESEETSAQQHLHQIPSLT